ncbi:RNA helicase domain-containing protein [Streptococcus suis]|uniref:RNA helicase domain-containing protein n=4 Tax=Streptococcus suis TaxID=1307 RepID=UPI000CF45351|nr:RNA helicase domain-containing protein [Streptococcus suis]
MGTKRRRSRLYFGMRNYKFETHNKEGEKVSDLTEEQWRSKVAQELEEVGASELTYIFHDNDYDDEDSTERKPLHVHFVARFKDARDYDPTMEKFKCEKRNFQVGRSESSALLYLTHTTPESISAKKTRYNVSSLTVIVVPEDSETGEPVRLEGEDLERWYRKKIAGRSGTNKVNTDDAVASIIDQLSLGDMALTDVKEELKKLYDSTTATMTWMKNKRYFKEAVSEYYENKYLEWLDKGRSFKLIYIDGKSGIGKTTFAREIAKRVNKAKNIRESLIHNAPNETRGGRYDFLNGYNQEAVTVFDDLGPKTFSYTEFLNLFEKERVAKYSSRFNDKAWFAEVAIITKSTPIEMWTKSLSFSELTSARSGEEINNVLYQPRRRFELVVTIRDEAVEISRYIITNKKTNAHRLEVLDKLEIPGTGFHDKEFQSEVLDTIEKRLGLKEATEKDLEKVQVLDDDE